MSQLNRKFDINFTDQYFELNIGITYLCFNTNNIEKKFNKNYVNWAQAECENFTVKLIVH